MAGEFVGEPDSEDLDRGLLAQDIWMEFVVRYGVMDTEESPGQGTQYLSRLFTLNDRIIDHLCERYSVTRDQAIRESDAARVAVFNLIRERGYS